MELWSLMHFLMPHIFRSRKEFSYWFSSPLSGMVEGNRNVNNDLIGRLHSIMRPFLLRRLKKDVAKQLPGKYEHVLMCKLSKRQMFLYEEFMARSTVKNALTGNNGEYEGLAPAGSHTRDIDGKTPFFVLCERMAHTVSGTCSHYSDNASLLTLVLQYCPQGGVNESSRLGQTAFDLLNHNHINHKHQQTKSCLQEVKKILVDASLMRTAPGLSSRGNQFNSNHMNNNEATGSSPGPVMSLLQQQHAYHTKSVRSIHDINERGIDENSSYMVNNNMKTNNSTGIQKSISFSDRAAINGNGTSTDGWTSRSTINNR